ncbi:DUF6879 family protein [Plantactinospora sp. KLBMP9567]|uniref:DUF6879 family protein n=1 Tax=Plantactinospora sp. KLBMP9567 TaxID=3085900 RepID=UPI002981F2B9|nr:DUF6879 family protein [Plantactinospora sp. KLBMP9567]MDW5326602.1 hypothetical protein [Plantactinospora sp. KLBMP9567]
MGMRLLRGEAFDNLLRTFDRTAFHLEVQDTYHTSEESEPLRLFLEGKPDDFAWHQPWLSLVAETTAAGRRVTRARVVTVPHVDYVRWGLTVAKLNIAAGEDIRWLPRHQAGGIDLPFDDYWLFDDSRVVFTIFEPSGQFAGGAETTDPYIVERCRTVHRQVWQRAVPHAAYVTN